VQRMFPAQYQFSEKIAQGGSAEIYRAVQSNAMGFERTVAIKRILSKHMGSAVHESMFVNEAKLLVNLHHSNIVQVYDLGFRAGAYFFVMEYVDGCDLRTVLNWFRVRGRLLPLECTVLIASELCKALNYMHEKTDPKGNSLELVHLDISPKNILLSFSGEVKLTDFGVASFQNDHSFPFGPDKHSVRGKFSYMSPEQALGMGVDHRSDLFSLGVLLFEMLGGYRPFQSDTLYALQKKHREKHLEVPLFTADVPSELEYMVLRCLGVDPAERYSSAREMLQDLLRFLFDFLETIPHQQLCFMMEEVKAGLHVYKKSMKKVCEDSSNTVSLITTRPSHAPVRELSRSFSRIRKEEETRNQKPVLEALRARKQQVLHASKTNPGIPPHPGKNIFDRFKTLKHP